MTVRKLTLTLLLLSSSALAQSPGGFVNGQVLTAPELNAALANKQDVGGSSGVGNIVITIPPLVGGAWMETNSIPTAAPGQQSEAINWIEHINSPLVSTPNWIFSGWHHSLIYQGGSWSNWPSGDGLSIWNNVEILGPGAIQTRCANSTSGSILEVQDTTGIIMGMQINGSNVLTTMTVTGIVDATHVSLSTSFVSTFNALYSFSFPDTVLQAKSMQNGVQWDGTGYQTTPRAWGHFNHFQASNPDEHITVLTAYDTFFSPNLATISNYTDYNCQNFTGQAFTHPISNMWCVFNQDPNKLIFSNGRLVETGITTVAALSMGQAADTSFTAQRAVLLSGAPPTISSGFGTTDTIVDNSGSAYFTTKVGATPGTSATWNMNRTATNGWDCAAQDYTSPDSFTFSQVGRSATQATMRSYSRTTGTATAPTLNDVIGVKCMAD